jgi:kynureninase
MPPLPPLLRSSPLASSSARRLPRSVGGDASADCERSVYLCGNSLGLQPRRAQTYLHEEMQKWAACGVEGHFRGARPWAHIDETVTGLTATLVGAESADEVAVMNSLSVNMHLLLCTFYRPTDQRHKIIIEDNAFCSDNVRCRRNHSFAMLISVRTLPCTIALAHPRASPLTLTKCRFTPSAAAAQHIFDSQIRLHGRDPAASLVRVAPRAGESALRTEDILAAIATHGAECALVCFSGVQFYSGQFFDVRAITAAAHAHGCLAGFDLAHAAGNVELRLHEWDVDFACWCSYKYLNSVCGP